MNGFDVSDPGAWEHVGSVDLACLNAGVITGDDGHLTELTDEQYRRAVGVNVDGVVFGVRRLDRVMPKGSTIVVTASLAGLTAIPDDPIYGLTKHAVVGFVRSVAPQLAERGIRIQAVCPGWADTALTANGFSEELEAARLPPALARGRRRGRMGGVRERGNGRGMGRPARPRAAALRVQGRAGPEIVSGSSRAAVGERADGRTEAPPVGGGAELQLEDAEARNIAGFAVLPGCSRNRRRLFPPVPTTNSRIPRARSSAPRASCGAKRS